VSQPVRTCVGCRQKADKAELLRLVWTATGLVADVQQRELGRGAYLHFRAECLEQAARRRAVGRALHVEGVTADQLERAARDLIQAAAT
jgi:predicted RNA-binding protein YlxR (DUF448 family)